MDYFSILFLQIMTKERSSSNRQQKSLLLVVVNRFLCQKQKLRHFYGSKLHLLSLSYIYQLQYEIYGFIQLGLNHHLLVFLLLNWTLFVRVNIAQLQSTIDHVFPYNNLCCTKQNSYLFIHLIYISCRCSYLFIFIQTYIVYCILLMHKIIFLHK